MSEPTTTGGGSAPDVDAGAVAPLRQEIGGERGESTLASTNGPITIGRLPAAELEQLVVDLVAGRVFTSQQIRSLEHDLASVFLPIAFGALHDVDRDEVEKIGVIYEYLEKAGPVSVNGYPGFTSCRFLHRDDWTIVQQRYAVAAAAITRAAAGEEVSSA